MIIGISGKKGSGKDLSGMIIQALTDKPTSFDNMEVITEEDIQYKVWDVPTFKNIKFADTLKDFICMLLGCTREKLEERDYKETPLPESWWYYKIKLSSGYKEELTDYLNNDKPGEWVSIAYPRYLVKTTPRLLLQLMGTECGRQILHPNLWVNAVMSNYKPIAKMVTTNIITSKEKGILHQTKQLFPDWVITDMRFPNELKAVKEKGITIRIDRTSEVYEGEHESETALDNAEFDYHIYNSGTIKNLVDKIREILIKENIL